MKVEETFQCPFCPFSTNSKNANLKIHIQNIHYEIKHKCFRCDMQFNTKKTLALHIARLHEGKVSFCDQCDYSAAERTKLREQTTITVSMMMRATPVGLANPPISPNTPGRVVNSQSQ